MPECNVKLRLLRREPRQPSGSQAADSSTALAGLRGDTTDLLQAPGSSTWGGMQGYACAQFWVLLSTENKIQQEVDHKMRHSVGMQCWWYFRSDLELRISGEIKIEGKLSVVWVRILYQNLLWHLKVIKITKIEVINLLSSKEKYPDPEKYLNSKVLFMSLWVRQLCIFGPKCWLLNSVIITVQYILGSVVLVEFLADGDLKFCSRHTFVSNVTDSKENRFIQNRFSTGWNSFKIIVPLFCLSQKNKQ